MIRRVVAWAAEVAIAILSGGGSVTWGDDE
jgi:hypothetical protein